MVALIGNDELEVDLTEWLDIITILLNQHHGLKIDDDERKQLDDAILLQVVTDHSDNDDVEVDTIDEQVDEVDGMVELEDMVALLHMYVVDYDDEVEVDIHELLLLEHIIQLHNVLLVFHI